MNKLLLATFLSALASLASFATLYTTNWNSGFANGGVVPDNNFSGWSDSRTLGAAPAGTVTPGTVAVTLNLSGGWNGDLYAYLVNSSSGFCVLLNRVGTPGQTYGYADTGFLVTLGASGAQNIHNYQSFGYPGNLNGNGQITGTWLPDATSGSLSSFTTQGGTWSLFIADLSVGGVTTVQSWGLQMDIVAVPEVETWVAAALAGAFGAFWLNRQIFGAKQS
jgi:subtilisin-like proprotein convertase family protein